MPEGNGIESLYADQRAKVARVAEKAARLKESRPEYGDPSNPDYRKNAEAAIDAKVAFALYREKEKNKANDAWIKDKDIDTMPEAVEAAKKFERRMNKEWRDKAASFGLDGARALRDFESELDTGMVASITKSVYNKNRGGIQWGGIIGAVGGVMLGLTAGQSFGLTGWMATLAIIAGALVGVFAGGKGGELISGMMNKKKDGVDLSAIQDLSLEQQQGQGQGAEATAAVAPANVDLTAREATRIMKQANQIKRDVGVIEAAALIQEMKKAALDNPEIDKKRLEFLLSSNPISTKAAELLNGQNPGAVEHVDIENIGLFPAQTGMSDGSGKKPTEQTKDGGGRQ